MHKKYHEKFKILDILAVTTQAHEGIETTRQTWQQQTAWRNNSSPWGHWNATIRTMPALSWRHPVPVPGKKVWSAYCSFLLSGVKTVIFFLCKVEHYSIIKPVFLISLKAIIRKSAKYVATNTVRLVKLIMWFIILFAIVAAVCVITVIVTVLRKKSKWSW